jgi:Bacterial membrane protein YfhO
MTHAGFDRLAPLVAALVVLLFFADVWATSRVFAAGDVLVHLPLRAALGRALRHPSSFLWSADLFAGYPTFADLNATPYYPFDTGWFLWLSPATAYVWATITQYLIAAGLTAAFLVRIGARGWAAVFGAVVFALGTPMVAQLQHIKIVGAAAWTPLAFLAAENAVRGRLRTAGWQTALAVTCSWIGGDPQIAAYAGISTAVYAAVRCWQTGAVAPAPWLALFAFLGTAMAAIQLLPMHELAARSNRLGAPTVAFALTGSLPPWRLAGFLAPYLFGGPKWGLEEWTGDINFFEGSCYVGLLTLALVAAALLHRDRRAAAFVAVAALAAFLALGRYNPIAAWISGVPPFLYVRVPARWMIPCSFALACLAALGCQRLFDPLRVAPWSRALRWITLGLVAWLALALLANLLVFGFPGPVREFADWWVASRRLGRPGAPDAESYRRALDERWIPNVRASVWIFGPAMGLPLMLAALALATLSIAPRAGRRLGQPSLVAVLLADLWLTNHDLDLNAAVARDVLESAPQVVRFLWSEPRDGRRVYAWWGGGGRGAGESGDALAREFATGDREAWLRGFKEMLPMNVAALWNVPLFNAHSPTWLADQERAVDEIEGAKPKRISWEERFERLRAALPLLRAASIRYILSPVDVDLTGLSERFRAAALDGGFAVRVYELDSAMPRAYWVPRLRSVPDDEALWRELFSASFDAANEALAIGVEEIAAAGRADAEVVAVAERPTERVYRVAAQAGGILVLTESQYPGWSATVNDHEQPILEVDGMFQAVHVPAGTSVVRFAFRPRSLARGACITLAGVLATVVACAMAPRGPRG